MNQVLADLIYRCVSLSLMIGAPTVGIIVGFNAIQKRKIEEAKCRVEEAKEKSVGTEAIKKITQRVDGIDGRTDEKCRQQEDRNERFRNDMVKMFLKIPD